MAEYEACIMGLEEAIDLRIKYLDVCCQEKSLKDVESIVSDRVL
jgi:hypothetical protein